MRRRTSNLSVCGRLVLLLTLLSTAACASRGPTLAQMGADALFAHGLAQLEAEEWSDAIRAFEQFTISHATDPRNTEARYHLAEAYMGRGDYLTAAMEFNRLSSQAGPLADDARFQACRAYYELTLPPQLDQEYTHTALEHCQALLAYHPDSEHVEPTRDLMDELTARLAEKVFITGDHYFRRRAYDSANIYFQIVADEYPATRWAPRALLRLIESYERLGYGPEAEEARARLLREFPDSPEARQVNGVTTDRSP